MADEVIIIEMSRPPPVDGVHLSALGNILTTQVLDIATASAEFNEKTTFIRIRSKGTGFWYKTGLTAAAAAATADTDGNDWIAADSFVDIVTPTAVTRFVDTAADA